MTRALATVTAELRAWIATFGTDAGRLREFPSRLTSLRVNAAQIRNVDVHVNVNAI